MTSRLVVLSLIIVLIGLSNLGYAETNAYTNRKKKEAEKYWTRKARQANVTTLKNGVMVEKIKTGINHFAKSPRAKDKLKGTFTVALTDGEPFESASMIFSPHEVMFKVRMCCLYPYECVTCHL